MSQSALMQVRVRLPARLLYEGPASAVQAVADNGAFGLLPQHADFVSSLVPSVLVLRQPDGSEHFFGIDHGLLVKSAYDVDIAVRRGVQGDSLDTLSDTVVTEFMEVDDDERAARTALARLEIGILRHFSDLRKPV